MNLFTIAAGLSRISVIIAIALTSALATPARAQPQPPDDGNKGQRDRTGASSDDDLTTDVWKDPGAPIDLHWHILALPEYVVQLAFTPVAILLTTVERYRLDKRFLDLLEIGEHIKITPKLKVAVGEGFGAGLNLGFDRIWDSELDISALGRLNGDYELGVEFEKALAFAEGRRLNLTFRNEVDGDLRYYGLGPDSVRDDRRVIHSDVVEAYGRFDLSALGTLAVTGAVEGGFRHERLAPGSDPAIPSLGEPGDTVMPPGDFGRSNEYATARAVLQVDTRDTAGRPARGLLAEAIASFSHEVTGEDFGSLAGELTTQWFFPLLPYRRVLVFAAGMRVARPVFNGHELPLFEHSTLGRRSHLRGYNRFRFIDRHRWWATLEYRFPIYEYLNSGIAADAVIFFDVGRVGGNAEELFGGAPKFSGGIGVRGGHEVINVFELNLGVGDEGPVLGFTLGKSI